jgi:hypothetical protein
MVITMGYIKKEFPALVTMVVVLLVFWSMPACGAERNGPESKEITIQNKTKAAVAPDEPGQKGQQRFEMTIYTDEGPFYILSDTTVINKSGKMISMDNLPTPCKARITYQPLRRNSGNALKIEITEILKGASTAWYKPTAD